MRRDFSSSSSIGPSSRRTTPIAAASGRRAASRLDVSWTSSSLTIAPPITAVTTQLIVSSILSMLTTSAIDSADTDDSSTRLSAKPVGSNAPTAVFDATRPVHLPTTRPATNNGTSTQPCQSAMCHAAPATIRNSRCTGRSRWLRMRKIGSRCSFGKLVTSTPARKHTTIGDSDR